LNENEACCGSCCFFVLIIVGCVLLYTYIPEFNIAGIIAGFILMFGPIAFLVLTSIEKKRKEAELRLQEAERQRIKAEYEANMQARGFVKFVDRQGKEKWGTPQQVREWKAIDLGLRDNFASYAPRTFEKFIARLLGEMGYATELGKYVGDYGADIIARKGDDVVLVQVKRYQKGNNVGAPEVQKALGAMWKFNANKAVFVTTSDFTIQAEEQAKGAPIELWNHKTLEKLVEKYLIEATHLEAQRKEYSSVREVTDFSKENTEKHETSIHKETRAHQEFAAYVKEGKMDEKLYCSVCGREISREDYESYDGLCWECWDDQITEEYESEEGII